MTKRDPDVVTNVADVLILTTGGTIDKLYFDALSTYQIGESVVAPLLHTARVTMPFRLVELMRKDSLELDDADRATIAATVADAPEQRVIITHGTDTMTQTAQALEDIAGKTIVLVGALAPARSSTGPRSRGRSGPSSAPRPPARTATPR